MNPKIKEELIDKMQQVHIKKEEEWVWIGNLRFLF